MEIKTKLNARVMQGCQKSMVDLFGTNISANKITIPLGCYPAVFSVVTQRSAPQEEEEEVSSVTTLKTAV